MLAAVVGIGIQLVHREPSGERVRQSHSIAVTNFSGGVSEASPAPATDYLAEVLAAFREADPTRRAVLFGTSFGAWFEHDPKAALAWLRQMPPGNEYTQGLFIALPAIAKKDPQYALVLASDMATTH